MIINIIGTGAANEDFLLVNSLNIIKNADVIIGAKRLTQCYANENQQVFNLINAEEIAKTINSFNNTKKEIVVLMSGDVGFYSGTKSLLPYLDEFGIEVNVIPGISSVQLFSSKLKMPWQNWKLNSAHGIECNIYPIVSRNIESFFLTGGKWTVNEICKYLCDCDLGNLDIFIGEDLGTEDEKISNGKIEDFTNTVISNLSVCLIINDNPIKSVCNSINDDDFIRGNIPMTKQEVRSVIIAKLRLNNDDIVYDVGAGTGSVSIEAALASYNGTVYAIEREAEGIELIKANAKKHKAFNVKTVEGSAPEAMENLPKPDAVFIGGSGGNLAQIVDVILKKNPFVKLVITSVTLETLNEILILLQKLNPKKSDISQIVVSHSKKLGNYHLMMGQNPIYVISAQFN